jgi:16S rRNA (cytosine967-C5)-methyltransferase
MRMSVYQIMFMDSVPDSAACNEAVKLASKHKFVNLKGFVNGVLRNISRNKDSIAYPDKEKNGGADYLSVVYSMPLWICEKWLERFGFEKTENMLKFFLEPRPTTVRLNRNFFENDEAVDAFIKELEDAGAVVKKNALLPYVLELEKTDNIRFLPGFMEGKFTVQDCSSILLTETADPQPGQTVIDVCAAPGGKSLHAAERVGASGKVISRDVSERKCDLIRDNADRMGLTNITVEAHDARQQDESLSEKADVLYLDVPCSGLGIMGRKNDIKYNITEDGIRELNALQWEIVKTSWSYVKKDGILMYSTCTVSKSENEDMVDKICSELPFEVVSMRQIIPGEDGCDGFFIAKLRRKN